MEPKPRPEGAAPDRVRGVAGPGATVRRPPDVGPASGGAPAPEPGPRPLVEARGVSKRFPGVLALDGVSLAFRAGEVHAVIGENGAGKSTLMNVLAGDLQPDEGVVLVGGQETRLPSPLASQAAGITVVYQELALCPNLTVAENVALPATARRHAATLLPRGEMRHHARRALARLGMDGLDLDAPVGRLSVAEMQLVEIARALGRDTRLLVLDEPNSALSPRESERLFEIVRALRTEGVGVVYVSHHLSEVLALADRISVMRDGRLTETMPAAEACEDRLVRAMVGREVAAASAAPAAPQDAREVLRVEDLSAASIRGISFALRAGEVLGVGGLPDSGKDALGEALLGLVPREGRIEVEGREVPPEPRAALAAGMAYVPADRRGAGALLSMSVAQNVVAATLPRFSLGGWLRSGSVRREARAQVARLDARISGLGQRLGTLSGGNQQKIILARGLVTGPRALILHEPTRGVDVGAKAEIHAILRGIASEGVGVLLISSELPELVAHASRVLVMRGGVLGGELVGPEITEEAVMARAA